MNERQKQDEKANVGWSIVNTCAIVAASVLFNFFPEKVGMIRSATDPSSFTPLLAPEFQSYLPWLNVWWGLTLSLNVVHVILRRRTVVTRWASLVARIFAALVLGWMAVGTPFIINPWISVAVKFGLAFACGVMLSETNKHFKHLLNAEPILI